MSENAYIKLVPASAKQSITLEEVNELLTYYKEITTKTGAQLDWDYGDAALPYSIKAKQHEQTSYLSLEGQTDRYKQLLVGVGQEEIIEEDESTFQSFIQITLPSSATHGDKGKGNELCKFLAKKLEGELHLFNGRVMYFYKRK